MDKSCSAVCEKRAESVRKACEKRAKSVRLLQVHVIAMVYGVVAHSSFLRAENVQKACRKRAEIQITHTPHKPHVSGELCS